MATARRTLALTLSFVLSAAPALAAQTYPTAPDPRNGLKPGMLDAATAEHGLKLVSFSPKPAEFDTVRGLTFINSDIAFRDHYVFQGNFAGFTIWDVKNPAKPVRVAVVPCITSQGDPSIIGHLLFVSAEGNGNRNDCAKGGVKDPSEHMAGVRIYDVADPAHPRLVKNVQTCKGSHTHTVVPDPKNSGVVYLYVSGFNAARPATELAGCNNGTDAADTTNSMYRLDVIRVPLAHPEQAEVVTGARVFTGLDPAAMSAQRSAAVAARASRDTTRRAPPLPTGPANCHDVTAYPSLHLLAGA